MLFRSPFVVQPSLGGLTPVGVDVSGTLYVGQSLGGRDVQIATVDFENGRILSLPETVAQQFIGNNQDPAFSPDRNYVAYVSERGRNAPVLVIQSLENREVRDFRTDLTYFNQLAWSPDSRSIAVRGTDLKGRGGLFVIDAKNGATSMAVSSQESGPAARPIWSTDGTRLLFRRRGTITSRELSSGAEHVVLPTGLTQPRLSPDGQLLAGIAGQGRSALLIVPVSGGAPRELAHAASGRFYRSVDWSPDGKAVIVSSYTSYGEQAAGDTQLCWVPLDGRPTQAITLPVGGDFSIHPDGHRIAFTTGQVHTEVLAIENLAALLHPKR